MSDNLDKNSVNSKEDPPNRRAIIVGISSYEDRKKLKGLKGAVNDAEDIRKRLKSDYQPLEKHFLTNENATSQKILEAISDVFYHTHTSCEVALFYFSGHGVLGPYGELYLAPYDMKKDHPLTGIKWNELKAVMSRSVSKTKHIACAIALLDCCYSGTATKNGGESPDPEFGRKIKENLEKPGKGFFILSSSGERQQSREVKLQHKKRNGKGRPHYHGAWTYCLLEGLHEAPHDEAGYISLATIHSYIKKKLKCIKSLQTSEMYLTSATGLETARFAKNTTVFMQTIRTQLLKAKNYCHLDRNDEKGQPFSLIDAIGEINEVLKKDPKNEKANHYKRDINTALLKYAENANIWLPKNKRCIIREISRYTYNKLAKLAYKFPDFHEIALFDETLTNLFGNLCEAVVGKIDKDTFISEISPFDNPPPSKQHVAHQPLSSDQVFGKKTEMPTPGAGRPRTD